MRIHVHLMEREETSWERIRGCDQLCTIYESQMRSAAGASVFQSASPPFPFCHSAQRQMVFCRLQLRKQLKNTCVPRDEYVGCFYSQISFTSDFYDY